MSVKDHVEEIKSILAKYIILSKRKKNTNENPDTTEDFQYQFP
jgi:hypothetical protein